MFDRNLATTVRNVNDFIILNTHVQKKPTEVFCKKKLSLKISQYSKKNTCVEVSL